MRDNVSGASPDIQESIRRALEKSEERFRRVVESSPSAMVLVGARGQIEMVNAQTERMFGYAREELLGQSVDMLVPERFRRNHPALRASFFLNPGSRPMGAGRDLYALRKDGSEFPVEIGLNPLETEDGVMVLSAIVDISVHKRMEERFRQVVESAPNAMVMVDMTGIIHMVNSQAEIMFGYRREEMVGRRIELLVPDHFRDGHPELRASFFSDPRTRPMGEGRDLYARRSDGSEFPVEIGLNPIETDEGMRVLSAIVDISDRRQKEDSIRAALAEKDILLGEIHHRVKNNLQIVCSLLDLQSGRIGDEAVVEMLRDSQNRVKSMALIHQTLYQSKNFSQIDFASFLPTLCTSLLSSYGLEPGRLDLHIEAADKSLPLNTAIPCGLIVNELVTNALKHAFPDGRRGVISLAFEELEGDTVRLCVSDDGPGIPDHVDFHNAATLGLQLVHLLTEQLQGQIDIRRAHPTSFTLTFSVDTEEYE